MRGSRGETGESEAIKPCSPDGARTVFAGYHAGVGTCFAEDGRANLAMLISVRTTCITYK